MVGIVVLIGLSNPALFAGHWLVMRRRFWRSVLASRGDGVLGYDGGELDRKISKEANCPLVPLPCSTTASTAATSADDVTELPTLLPVPALQI